MLANAQPSTPSFGRSSPIGAARQPKRPTNHRDGPSIPSNEKEPLWIPMLQSASKGKDLSEKHLVLLGGTPNIQREFLEQINPESNSRQNVRSNDRRRLKQNIPISNKFALGYTYHDVLDADQEDVLARLNVHMLANPSGQFASLLQPLLNSNSVRDTIVTILLDWSDPFSWARQLRQWIRLLRKAILALDEETKIAMEETMNAWKARRLGPDAQSSTLQEIVAPPGPGEWDEGLGIPISIVCVQSEKIEKLERELGWGDDQFDFLQQWLRTVLLKHGGSLVYTASYEPNNVKTLIHTSLGIQSLLKREVAKHNVVDRDKILVPPNWDSWGKIRILREGFDPEVVSNAWSIEIQDSPEDILDLSTSNTNKPETESEILASTSSTESATSAVKLFEQSLPNPNQDTQTQQITTTETIVTATPLQEFLQTQSVILEKLKAEDIAAYERMPKAARGNITTFDSNDPNATINDTGSMSPIKGVPGTSFLTDSIGSHRINVNGIDLDAEEATRRLRERENERNALRRTGSESVAPGTGVVPSGAASPVKMSGTGRGNLFGSESPLTPSAGGDGKPSNEALHGFFANLIKKGEQGRNRGAASNSASGVGSGTASPRRESPAPGIRREE